MTTRAHATPRSRIMSVPAVPLFHPDHPKEDVDAWHQDTCFLTRMAQMPRGPLRCVATVMPDNPDATAAPPEMRPAHGIVFRAWRFLCASARSALHRLWAPSNLLVLDFGPSIDMSTIATTQLLAALQEALSVGDSNLAAHIAAELAARRQTTGAPVVGGSRHGSPPRGSVSPAAERPAASTGATVFDSAPADYWVRRSPAPMWR